MSRRKEWPKAYKLHMPKALRSAKKVARLHAEAQKTVEQRREETRQWERLTGIRS
jgi:hypothetical protein